MFDLRDLYQEVIVDHNRHPRNYGRLEAANYRAEGFNPLCGDRLTLYLKVNDAGVIEDVRFEGSGCAISVASASLMSEQIKGKSVSKAEALFEAFHNMVLTEPNSPVADDALGKLTVLAGVREFPARIKCATLCWHTMHAALAQEAEQVSTEGSEDDRE